MRLDINNTTQTKTLYRHFFLLRFLGQFFCLILILFSCSILFKLGTINSGKTIEEFDFKAIIFILKSASWQALLSCFFSIMIGLFCARTLHKRRIQWLTQLVLSVSFLAFVIPSSVASLGIVAVWGRTGIVGGLNLGVEPFGLWMVILAHIFFNAPLVIRICFSVLNSQPNFYWKLAAQNKISPLETFIKIEYPVLSPLIMPLFSIIFLLCFTSFSIVLMLGGGPSVTTLEVSIYHAVRFSYDLPFGSYFKRCSDFYL